MKKLILLALLFSIGGFSQTNGKIYFKNGEVFEGAIAQKSSVFDSEINTKIIYTPEDGVTLTKGSEDIDKIELLSDKNNEVINEYYFKEINNSTVFLEKISSHDGFDIYLGHDTVGVSDLVPGFSRITTDYEVFEEYYIAKTDATKFEKFHKRASSKKFKSLLVKYFGKDSCDSIDALIEKYRKNKKLKKRELFSELESVCN